MGCSCTKGEVPGKNGLERRRSSDNNEAINIKTSNKPSGIFRRLSLKNLFKENNTVNKDANLSKSEANPSENNTTIKTTATFDASLLAPNSIAVKIQTTPVIQDRSKTDGSSVYSFSNLPSKTQNLLNAQYEFDSEFANYVATININKNCKTNYLKDYSNKTNINKEIKIYLSTSTSEEVEMFSIFNSFQKDNVNDDFFDKLCSNCLKDFDLSLINFNSKFNQVNKYYRRLLSKLIINDLLSISCSPSNYSTPGYFVFSIILSNCEFNDESSLLCPDEIDLKDFESYISIDFNEQELSLFNKWYQLDKNEEKYKLNLFNNADFNQLDDLLNVFINKYTCNLTESTAINNEHPQFCFKYLKSIQENEIDLVVNHIDPSAIVWLNLTQLKMNEMSRFNQLRFQAVLKLLQSHVLTHNYKECKADAILSENILNKFLFNSIKSLVDQFVEDLSKKISANNVLKIDQNLSDELLKHYEIYKYLRIKYEHSTSNSKKQTNSNFVQHLNDYLIANNNKSVKYPLIVNSFKETCDEIISKWISDTITSSKKNHSIVYRFCGHSILASNISTLFQSIFHQICYLLNIHESWSFDNVSSIIDNLSKALELNKTTTNNNKDEESIIIFIDRIDRLLHSKYEQNILLKLLDKIYNNSSSSSNLKLILTFSSTTDQFLSLIQPIKDLFKVNSSTESFVHSLLDESENNYNSNDQVISLKESMYSLLKENNLMEANKLIDVLIDLVTKSRYGLKQKEIFDLLRLFNKKHSICSKTSFNYCVQILWYTFKNYSLIFNRFNLIETLVENNQILYKLPDNTTKTDLNNIKELFNDYFKLNLNTRAYQELSNVMMSQSFIINYDWFLKKNNVLYFMQDLECFKYTTTPTLVVGPVKNETDEFKLFEHLFYKTMYALHQDPNQIYNQFKTYLNFYMKQNEASNQMLLHSMLSNLEDHFKSTSFFCLTPLNLEYIIENEVNKLDREKIAYNSLKKESTYLSKVVFLNSNTILALSDTHNEIKIWKITNNSIQLVRSIKLNKTPRDLRLLNQKIAVILVDRNLHLFDLNESKHILDMNTTMSEKVPFFEIHDQNHVVLLARNRLSVILMKVTPPLTNNNNNNNSNNNKEDASLTVKQPPSTTNKNYSVDDDMFLFKVGEDRYLNSLLVSKNGQVMVCGDEVQKPFPLLVWNLNKRKLVYDLRQAKHEFITSIQSIGSSGKFVVCACQEEGELKNCFIVYDLMTGQLFKKLKAKSNYVAVEICEELNVLIACLENAQIIVYDLTNGSEKFIIDNNRFPINNIKMLDTNKNIFITYDTKGYDWTIRAWDLTKLDTNPLVSSFTCPTRIVSCSINVDHFNSNTITNSTNESFIGLALYGIQQPLILKLIYNNNNISTTLSLSPVRRSSSENNSELFNKIEQFNKEINL